jgi:hypothetical protein
MTPEITTVRHSIEAAVTVYLGQSYRGTVFLPVNAGATLYIASPWPNEWEQRTFPTESEAVAYLAEVG